MTAAEGFGGHKGFQIFVIGENLDRIVGSFKVMTPMSHAFDNGKQFSVMDIIVALSWGALTRVEGNRVPMGIVELAYDARYRKSRGIGM